MFWARLVDVHDVDEQGGVNLEPLFRDFAINENIQSDGVDVRLEINPISQKTRLVILRQRGAPDSGAGTFDSLLRFAASGLPAIVPKHDDGTTGDRTSLVARNSALVLRFDDVLEDRLEAQRDLIETVRIKTGYPPETPFPARLIFDPNHGAVVSGEFHSTRVLIDSTISPAESSGLVVPQPINVLGLPPSLNAATGPNVSVRLPTRTDFGTGQFELLRSLSGVPLAPFGRDPVDLSVSTRDIVRAMRSGNSSDANNGFLLDLSAPEILGSWSLRVESAVDLPGGRPGFDFSLDVTFTTVCRTVPRVAGVVSINEAFLEVTREGAAPDGNGGVRGLHVSSLSDRPIPTGDSLLGNARFLSTFQPAVPVAPGCWVNFEPAPASPPATGVPTSARVTVRFSEAMDPTSLSPFDGFYLVRGHSSSQVSATSLVVGERSSTPDLREFSLQPTLPLSHDTNTPETYHVRIAGPTDLAGNALASGPAAVNFEIDPSEPAVRNGGTVLRFGSPDEIEPLGFADLRGQFFIDLERQVIRPRPVAFASYPADRTNPVPSVMIPFGPGVQTPLSALGSKLQTVWRYCDFGWQVLDETKYNLDVFGLAWAPRGGGVINDFFENFEIRLSHSRYQPDETANILLFTPRWPISGLVRTFDANILNDPRSPQKIVHPRSLGYRIARTDLFVASSGTVMLPYPLNRVIDSKVTYTWRDTAVQELGSPGGNGIPLDIEAETLISVEQSGGYVAPRNEVPSFGLPLLLEFRCFPSDSGLGLNPLDISLASNASAQPSFRAYSTGGINTAGVAVKRNPDEEPVARGGFNPLSNPPGRPTLFPDDISFYIGQLDVVPRLSRVHSVWIDTSIPDPDFDTPVILPAQDDQPAGTEVIVEYRGADGFVLGDLDEFLGLTDESTFPFDSRRLNAYGDVFAILPVTRGTITNPMMIPAHVILGSNSSYFEGQVPLSFPGSVQYVSGPAWTSDIDSADGARYLQLRVTFVSNIDTGLSPELSAIGIPYSDP